jgi:hypothetical protein
MDRYSARINLHGTSQRERLISRCKDSLTRKLPDSGAYKSVKLNGEASSLVINSGTKPYYKEFTSLPGQTVLAGDYVEWANNTWLIYEADCDDEVYIDGKMYQCNYIQRWQNENGTIIERPSYVTRESSTGEDGNKTITLGANEYFVYMPYDEETVKLRNGERVYIDFNSNSPNPYILTLPDNVSMKFGSKGVLCYLFEQTEKSPDKDKLITLESGEKAWIADYISPTPTPEPTPTTKSYIATIVCTKAAIASGSNRKFTAKFTDTDGNVITTLTPKWTVTSDFSDKLTTTYGADYIRIGVDDDSLINEHFMLKLESTDDSAEPNEISILITSLYGG